MVAWYSKSIIRSSSCSLCHWHPLTVCLMWRSRSAVVSRFVLSEVCQVCVSEMPKWSWLFEALLESVPYLLYYLTVCNCVFKSVPAVVCFIASCHKYEGPLPLLRDLVCHEDHFHSPLEDLPSGYLVCCSPVHLRILLPWYRRHAYCN